MDVGADAAAKKGRRGMEGKKTMRRGKMEAGEVESGNGRESSSP